MTDDIHLSQLCTSHTSSSGTGWNTIINTSQPRHIYYISIYHISYILPIISSAQLGYLLILFYFVFNNYILQYTALKTIFFHSAEHIFLWPCYWSDGNSYKSLFWYQTCDRSSEDHYNIIRMSSITQSQYKQSHHQDASLSLSLSLKAKKISPDICKVNSILQPFIV